MEVSIGLEIEVETIAGAFIILSPKGFGVVKFTVKYFVRISADTFFCFKN